MVTKIILLLTALSVSTSAESLPIPTWKMLESMDIDKNDLITKEEFISSDKIFDFIDKDSNGELSATELRAARKTSHPVPKVGEPAPTIKAYDPISGKIVSLSNRDKPYALIFGTHT